MTNVVNLSDYRPKTEVKITGKLDSKKVCELMSLPTLLYALTNPHTAWFYVDGELIVLDKDDIEAEIRKRD